MRQLLVTITMVLAVMFSAVAQTTATPDFSGTWVLNAAKSTLPKDNTIKSQTIVIDNKKSAIIFPLQNRRQEIDGDLYAGWEEARLTGTCRQVG